MSHVRLFSNRAPMLSALTAALCLWGCSTDTSPTRSNGAAGQAASIAASEFEPVAFSGAPSGAPAAKAAGTGSRVHELISAEQGGQLLLDWEAKNDDGVTGAKVKVEVTILPDALEKDRMISIRLIDPDYAMVTVALDFGTHVTDFKIPAEVELDAEGLDLSSYSSEDEIDLYWYDRTSKTWSPVRYEFKEVDLDQGTVRGLWYFDHFSRYAMGRGR